MFRAFSCWIVAAALLLSPLPLMAGGPPVVFLPVNGVTAENAPACAKVLTEKLGSQFGSKAYDVKVLKRSGEWYIAFPFEKDVRLSSFASALKDSPYSISLDDLSLFGHVILEVESGGVPTEQILSGLKNIGQVAVEKSQTEKSQTKEKTLMVTLDIPYPVGNWRPDSESAKWDQFQRNDFSSVPSSDLVTPQELPAYSKIHKMLSAKKAKLVDLRWSTDFWCRPLGAIKSPDASEEVAKGK